MTSVQIRCFLEAAHSGSFTEAAEKLYMTQPTFGRQISSLETELGFPLFCAWLEILSADGPRGDLVHRSDGTDRAV